MQCIIIPVYLHACYSVEYIMYIIICDLHIILSVLYTQANDDPYSETKSCSICSVYTMVSIYNNSDSSLDTLGCMCN